MSTSIKQIKHYEILKPIGKGGMGEVFLAQDTNLDRKVAIKFLPEELQQDQTARDRFIREAKSAAALDHPFICKIFEAGEVDGKAYIVMEYVEGEDLGERLKKDSLPLQDSLNITLEIAEALEKAHKNNIVHRDLKPANIMLTPQGHVKVMDFGLAKKVLPSGEEAITKTITQASITEQGVIAGTLSYMSPEQAKGEEIDQRSDIFSLGIILQEMLAGAHPFTKASAIETLSAILRDHPPHPNIKPKNVNPVLTPILKKALAKDPSDRYSTTTEFAQDIRKAQKELTGGIRLPLHGWKLVLAGAFIIAILALGIWTLFQRSLGPNLEVTQQPISVIITDFQNQTGDPDFNESLEELLKIGLEGAPHISVYERSQARELAKQLDPGSDGKISQEMARMISSREGINLVVDGSITQSEDEYTINVLVLDTVDRERQAEFPQKIKTKEEVLKAIDSLSAKLRKEMGDIKPESAQVFAQETFTASSLVALNAYARGQELMHTKRKEAIEWFNRALDNDPNLGRAYAGLASVYHNLQQHDEAEKYYGMALARIDQMTEREKHRTQGGYYLLKRDYKKAIEEFSALADKYPADTSGITNLAFAYFFSLDMAKAAEVGRRAVELNPNESIPRYNLVWYTLFAGDYNSAEKEIHALIKLDPEYWDVYVCKALVELAQGQLTRAMETYQYLENHSDYGASLATTGLADIAFYEGRLSDTKSILEKGIRIDIQNGQEYIAADKYIILAQTYLLEGKKDLAVGATEKAIEIAKREEFQFSAAEIFIQADQEDKARDLAGELQKNIEPLNRAYSKMIGGELSLKRGDVSGAIDLFQEAQNLVDIWLSHFMLGRAYLEANAFSQAYSEFNICLKRRGEVSSVYFNDLPTYRYLPPLYYYLGRAQEGLNSDQAADSYNAFLIIKEKGDGDWMVEDARQRINK
jgi:serine/threonine protein kinase/tetratricopeptide (TPR) repeat protein